MEHDQHGGIAARLAPSRRRRLNSASPKKAHSVRYRDGRQRAVQCAQTFEEWKVAEEADRALREARRIVRAQEALRRSTFALSRQGAAHVPAGVYAAARALSDLDEWFDGHAQASGEAVSGRANGSPLNATGLFAQDANRLCAWCRKPMVARTKRGRPRATCGPDCRKAADADRKRRSRAGMSPDVRPDESWGRPLPMRGRVEPAVLADGFSPVGRWLNTAENEWTPVASMSAYRSGKPAKAMPLMGATDRQGDGAQLGPAWSERMAELEAAA